MSVSVIPLRLDSNVEFESRMRTLYDAKPRARRQEWLRHLLQLGLAASEGGAVRVTPTLAEQQGAAEQPSGARVQLSAAPTAERTTAPAAPLVPDGGGESASAIRGFFDADALP